ncbi:MAG: fimbrial biogenesis outer membrane usher protein [Myxococcales bacterium]|nr:fimbrial biogenesis outer membrane usher protein [Myxococcales bacterium]USN50723.1 MAG: fimbrial biogenesis outer membrane usher protein [Myxococcales bacterium]
MFVRIFFTLFISFNTAGLCKSNDATQQLYLDVYANQNKIDGVHEILDQNHDYWIKHDLINLLHLQSDILSSKLINNESLYLLPKDIKKELSMSDLSLRLEIPSKYLTTNRIDFQAPSVEVNDLTYAFYWNHHLSLHHAINTNNISFESAHHPVFATPFGALSNQFSTTNGTYNNIVRLETSYNLDLYKNNMRLIVGDYATDAPSWGGLFACGGLKIVKNFSFQSGFLSYPTTELSGVAHMPGSAEIWINENLRHKNNLDTGKFILDNLNLPSGAQSGKLIVKDKSGIASVIPFSYFADPEILKPGLSAFSYSFGFLRKDYGVKSFSYGEPIFIGNHKIGVADFWTPSFYSLIGRTLFSLGAENRFRLFDFGSAAIALGLGMREKNSGYLVAAEFNLRKFDIYWSSRGVLVSKDFPSSPLKKINKQKLRISSAFRLNKTYLQHSSINYLFSRGEDDDYHSIGLKQALFLDGNLNLHLSSTYNFNQNNFDFFLYFSYTPANRHSMSLGVQKNDGSYSSAASYYKSADNNRNNRLSYALMAQFERKIMGHGNIGFGNNYMRSRLDVQASKESLSYLGQFDGSFGVIENQFFYSKPIEKGITLINIPMQKEIEIYKDNSVYLGQTNADGHLILSDLPPYQPTRLSINSKNLDSHIEIEDLNKNSIFVPGYKSAHRVDFLVKTVRHVLFRLVINGKAALAGTRIYSNDGSESGFVANDGLVYLNVPSSLSTYSGKLTEPKCGFEIKLPKKSQDILEDLGNVTCTF